jgi:branched-chain amino acid transport system ATP-binding protein
MLKLKDVNTYYGNIQALHNVNLEVKEGEIVALLGANGAGKTTTLMTISGIVPAQSGEIYYKNIPIHDMSPEEIVKLGICQVPEGRHIFPHLTVNENIELGAFLRKDKDQIKKDIKYVYELFPQLAKRKHQLGETLSGGEQQMLAISRALLSKPKLLLLDEPSLGLAPIIVKNIFQIIIDINKQGTTILLVEQNAHMALSIAHRGYVMETGKIALEDDAKALLNNEQVKNAYLGG